MIRSFVIALLWMSLIIALAVAARADEPDKQECVELIRRLVALKQAGRHAEAAQVGEELAPKVKIAYGAESPAYATILNNLGYLYNSMGEYAKAEPLYRRAAKIRRNALSENHPDYAISLNDLAHVYDMMGEYTRAEPLFLQALEIQKKALGENHPHYTVSLSNLAGLYTSMGEYAKAERLFRQALEIRKKTGGENHPAYPGNLNNLAYVYTLMGEYAKAEPLLRKALEIGKKAWGENHPHYAASLDNLGSLYFSMGDYTRAEPLFRKALEIRKKALGEENCDYAVSLKNLAALHLVMGEYAKAEPLLRHALEVGRKAWGENHPHYADSLDYLGLLYHWTGEDAKAVLLLQQALEIRTKTLGESHPSVSASLNDLAVVYEAMGEYAKAEPLHRQALEIRRKALGENHPQYAVSLCNLAALCESMGEYAEAERLYQQAFDIQKKALSENHPDRAKTLSNLAVLYVAWDRPGDAQASLDTTLDVLHRHTTVVLAGISDERQRGYLKNARGYIDTYLSLVCQMPRNGSGIYHAAQWLARWKALAAEVQTERARVLRENKDPRLRELVSTMTSTRQELARLTLSPPKDLKAEDVRKRREAAEDRMADLESRLAQQSSQFADLRRIGQAKLADIAAAMPADSVLLDYALFREFNFKAKGTEKNWGDWRYLLFITAAGKEPKPVLVELGLAKPIDEAIAAFRNEIGKVEKGKRPKDDAEVREKLIAIRKLVLDPALPQIRDKKRWIICPDGQISLVPFEALPVEEGEYLIETKKVSYLGAGRDAVAYVGPVKGIAKSEPSVLVGDPDFDLVPDDQQAELAKIEKTEPDASTVAMRGVGGSRELRQVLFSRLPATGAEVGAAARLTGGRKYVRRQALEGVVKGVAAPEVLYLATHGFFLPDQERVYDDRGMGLLSPATFARRGGGFGSAWDEVALAGPAARIENPLLRCGLALAGANRREAAQARDDVDDGILTGMEVAGLDLWGTKLVVLSACQTGLGDVEQGEGVMGLRRAFFLAGARRVLSTLWMVPDQQTQQLMGDFITRWKAGTPGADALRDAQIAMIQEMRRGQGHAHPFYWAAFTMTGDWR